MLEICQEICNLVGLTACSKRYKQGLHVLLRVTQHMIILEPAPLRALAGQMIARSAWDSSAWSTTQWADAGLRRHEPAGC